MSSSIAKKQKRVSDEELILACQSGDQDAWRSLMKRHAGAINRFINRAVYRYCDRDDAESAVYEAFMRAVRKFDTQRVPPIKFITFLWRALSMSVLRINRSGVIYVPVTARNTAAAQAIQVNSIHTSPDGDGSDSSGAIPDDRTTHRSGEPLDLEVIQRAVQQLSDRSQYIIEMRCRGKTLQEIGNTLGVTKERVRQLHDRAISDVKITIERHRWKSIWESGQ